MCINNQINVAHVSLWSSLTFFCLLFILLIGTQSCSAQEKKLEKEKQNVSAVELKKTTIPIQGMSCNSCVASVKKKLKSMEGLQGVEVSLEYRNATLTYEPGKITPGQVQQAINEIGYKAGEPIEEKKQ